MRDSCILDRTNAGVTVEIHYGNGNVALLVKEGENPDQVAKIDPSTVLDAFNHPYCYLPRESESESERPESLTEVEALELWASLRSEGSSDEGGIAS